MFDVKWIRDNAALFDEGLKRRGLEPLADQVLKLDDERKAIVSALQLAQERRNAASKEIGKAMAAKDMGQADAIKAEVAGLKDKIAAGEAEQARIDGELFTLLAGIPNNPKADVPDGADEHGNVEYRRHGERLKLDFQPKQHFELGEALSMLDFEAAARMSGARFVVIKGQLARLERAIGQFMLDLHTGEHGYLEVNPPLMVRDEAMFGTAQLPKFQYDQFASHVGPISSQDIKRILDLQAHALEGANKALIAPDFWLIPTAEVPLTNLVREQILAEDELPLRFTALTPCFRAEAGAAGRDTRGMLRQHQFNKVELVSITTPDQSTEEHERMLACAEKVLQKLGLHYRVMTLCTGDMGFASQKTYDIEVWDAGAGHVPRDFELLGLRRFPGSAHAGPLQIEAGQDRIRPYAERLRRRGRPRADRRDGELPERGRFDHRA